MVWIAWMGGQVGNGGVRVPLFGRAVQGGEMGDGGLVYRGLRMGAVGPEGW